MAEAKALIAATSTTPSLTVADHDDDDEGGADGQSGGGRDLASESDLLSAASDKRQAERTTQMEKNKKMREALAVCELSGTLALEWMRTSAAHLPLSSPVSPSAAQQGSGL